MSQCRRDSVQEEDGRVSAVGQHQRNPNPELATTDRTHNSSSDEEKSQTSNQRAGKDDLHIRRQAWGKWGMVSIWIGIALMWTVFELDYATVYNYQNYAASDFREISLLGALSTAGTIISAVLKPPTAKISDVIGRAETYVAVVVLYIISYVLCASAKSFGQYIGGFIIYSVGQTGLQILNQIIIADITSSRWRGLANGLVQLPYIGIPFAAAFLCDAVLADIGWRWGYGIYAIVMPISALTVIIPLLYFQHRFKRLGGTIHEKLSVQGFFTRIDIGGLALLSSGFAMILVPLSLVGNAPRGWSTPWIPVLIIIGVIFLVVLSFYEKKLSSSPVIPPRLVKNVSFVLACLMGLLDSLAYQITHTYLYSFVTVCFEFSPRNATFLTYTAGCVQVVGGLVTGYLMYKTKRYKWLVVIGCVIRLIGYGVMIRLRGTDTSVAELVVAQVIQGIGSGVVGTVVIVVAQVVVSRKELAQSTALVLLFIYLGNAIGASIAGNIYTSRFRTELQKALGSSVTPETVDKVFNTITEAATKLGPAQKIAVDEAYSNILKYMTIGALVASGIPMTLVWFLPNLKLSDKHNLADQMTTSGKDNSTSPTGGGVETRARKWKSWVRW